MSTARREVEEICRWNVFLQFPGLPPVSDHLHLCGLQQEGQKRELFFRTQNITSVYDHRQTPVMFVLSSAATVSCRAHHRRLSVCFRPATDSTGKLLFLRYSGM